MKQKTLKVSKKQVAKAKSKYKKAHSFWKKVGEGIPPIVREMEDEWHELETAYGKQ